MATVNWIGLNYDMLCHVSRPSRDVVRVSSLEGKCQFSKFLLKVLSRITFA